MSLEVELIPARPVAPAEDRSSLDVLVRILPPLPAEAGGRPPLNLGIVLDRSGSMGGEKIVRAREAVCYCLDQLGSDDRAAVVIFDDVVDVLIPGGPVVNPAAWKAQVQRIEPRSMTALHEAWVRGGLEVSAGLRPEGLNRVLLVTDGLANVGETRPDVIVSQVGGVRERGVSTTTIGVGDDFNELLLQAMAEAGDGNAWYVRTPDDFPSIFETELKGLAALFGRTASLGITPAPGARVTDLLNDFRVLHTGRYALPNLVGGRSLDVVVRLQLEGGPAGEECPVAVLRLAWDPADGGRRQVTEVPLRLRWATRAEVEATPEDPRAAEAVALLMAARAKAEVMAALERGDHDGATHVCRLARESLAGAPSSPATGREAELLEHLARLAADATQARRAHKEAAYQRHHRRRGEEY